MRNNFFSVFFQDDEGWTFVETLVVMSIVLVMTASVGFSSVKQIDKAKVVAAKSQIEALSLALESFYLDVGYYPSQDDGLEILWSESHGFESNWKGPYVAKPIPKDPWGNDYIYLNPGNNGLSYSVVSYAKDGKEGGSGYDTDLSSGF